MMQQVSLAATKVGVLTGSEGHRYAMKKNSIPEGNIFYLYLLTFTINKQEASLFYYIWPFDDECKSCDQPADTLISHFLLHF